MERRTWIALSTALTLALGSLSCGAEYSAPLPPRDGLYFPIGMELHPNGRFLYVVNSNFDLRYREDQGGTVSVIDTESGEILSTSSPFIPSFGGHIALNPDATKAYITSRFENEVIALEVAPQGGALYCGELQADTRPCRIRRLPDTREGARIPADPFGIVVNQVTRTIGGETRSFDVVNLSHIRGEQVTALSLPDGEVAGASLRSAALLAGGNQLVQRPGTLDLYVAPRNTNFVGIFRPYLNELGEVEAIIRRGTIDLTRRIENVDARGIAFDETGDRLFVATRRPAALHIIDMQAGPNDSPQVTTSIPLEARPSEVVFHRGADGRHRLYVSSYQHGLIEVIDVETRALVDTIEVGRSPYSMVAAQRPFQCRAPGERCLGFVSLFDAGPDGTRCDDDSPYCGAVAVIDLDPDSETFHQVIQTIR